MALELKTIQRTVVSCCDIPEEISMTNWAIKEGHAGYMVEHRVTPVNEQEKYDSDFSLDNWLIQQNPELEGRTILIDLDW